MNNTPAWTVQVVAGLPVRSAVTLATASVDAHVLAFSAIAASGRDGWRLRVPFGHIQEIACEQGSRIAASRMQATGAPSFDWKPAARYVVIDFDWDETRTMLVITGSEEQLRGFFEAVLGATSPAPSGSVEFTVDEKHKRSSLAYLVGLAAVALPILAFCTSGR